MLPVRPLVTSAQLLVRRDDGELVAEMPQDAHAGEIHCGVQELERELSQDELHQIAQTDESLDACQDTKQEDACIHDSGVTFLGVERGRMGICIATMSRCTCV